MKRRQSKTEITADAVAVALTAASFAAAAKAAAAAAAREQNWMCGICTDLYDKPAATPCGHTFCLVCIKAAIEVKEECPLVKLSSKCFPHSLNIPMQDMSFVFGPLCVKTIY